MIISDERHKPPITLLLRKVTPKFVHSRRKRIKYRKVDSSKRSFCLKSNKGNMPASLYSDTLKIFLNQESHIFFQFEGSTVFGMTSKEVVGLRHQ